VVFQGALPAARVRLGRTAPAAAPPLPEFLDKRGADTKALRNHALRGGPSFQRLNDPVTEVLRVWFHTLYDTGTVPYRQLQPALVLDAFAKPQLWYSQGINSYLPSLRYCMLRDRYAPMNLFAAIPTLGMRMDPVLAQMDALLDDDVLFQAVQAALSKRCPQTARDGSPSGCTWKLTTFIFSRCWYASLRSSCPPPSQYQP
jgi:hypothetical protein